MVRLNFDSHVRVLYLLIAFTLLSSTLRAEEPSNILFFGNSFTNGAFSSQSVPDIFQSIAIAAGRPMPNLVNAAVNGKDFTWHLENNLPIIDSGLLAEEKWYYVVMQNLSIAPTRIGDVNQHRADSVSLYQEVANHSPQVTPVLFETWARAPGHEFYSDDFEGPAEFPGGSVQMQQELREGYHLAAMDIDTAAGSGTVRIAPVGDTWESMDWRVNSRPLHASDRYHAANSGTLLAALTIYATIFEDDTADIDMSGVLAGLRLPAGYGPLFTAATDQTVFGVPEPTSFVLLALGTLLAFRQRSSAFRRSYR